LKTQFDQVLFAPGDFFSIW